MKKSIFHQISKIDPEKSMIVTLISFLLGSNTTFGPCFNPIWASQTSWHKNPPSIYPHRRFLAIFREFLNKMSQKKHVFSQHNVMLTKILDSDVWPIKCAHFKYHVNTMSTSWEILLFTSPGYKPVLENLTFKCSIRDVMYERLWKI